LIQRAFHMVLGRVSRLWEGRGSMAYA
jgi:hypothetical protein